MLMVSCVTTYAESRRSLGSGTCQNSSEIVWVGSPASGNRLSRKPGGFSPTEQRNKH